MQSIWCRLVESQGKVSVGTDPAEAFYCGAGAAHWAGHDRICTWLVMAAALLCLAALHGFVELLNLAGETRFVLDA